ncbi:MAG: hypothetical protein ABI208_09180 [Ginsengibacter sp.]
MENKKKESNKELMRYAGLAMQFLVAIGLAVFLGFKIDEWTHFGIPLAVWLLPLLFITGMIIKIVKDTSNK